MTILQEQLDFIRSPSAIVKRLATDPEQQYYFYELVFRIPLFLFTWLLASGIAYVTSKALGGSGPFDAILGGFGLTMAVSAGLEP